MDKLKMHSLDNITRNIEQIGQIFPNAITETIRDGKVVKAIDFEVLKQELSGSLVEGREERYQFTWPDKRKSMLLANTPITATLRPCREESVGKDGTIGGFDSENLYIEGDNLEVLKLLQETYLGKVKMIYIDPPYNTGNDFVYHDDFSEDAQGYAIRSGQYDEYGNRLVNNTESNGRFHTDWLNMIYPRLKIAKDLLSDDGFMFISIGEEELNTLITVCKEILGEYNYRNIIAVRRYDKNLNTQFVKEGLTTMNVGLEYILVFAKSMRTKMRPVYRQSSEERANTGYWKGFWNDANRPTMRYSILGYTPSDGQWKWKREVADEAIKNYEIYISQFSSDMSLEEYWRTTGRNKRFIRKNPKGKGKNLGVEHWVAPSEGILRNSNWSDILASKPICVNIPFDSPKNIDLVMELAKLSFTKNNDLVLDFFSGSATTAHAVMQLNAEDGGKRKFIMVQIPEKCAETSEAYKAGYKNICEIGKERIRRAGRKIKEENPLTTTDLDIGFRVLKLASSNMKDVYYTPGETSQQDIFNMRDNIKEDRSSEDLLFQIMLDLGVLLSSKIEEVTIAGKKVFNVAGGFLMACFDSDITDETIKEIAQKQPYYAVFKDAGMGSDSVAANFEQIFATYSPNTKCKIL